MSEYQLPSYSSANGLKPAVGIRNALLVAPLAWGALIVVTLWLVGVL